MIYRVDASGTLTTVHAFALDASEGAYPDTSLIQASDDRLYGAAPVGGPQNTGTVFRTDLLGNFEVVHTFDVSDGYFPFGGLLEASDGAPWRGQDGGFEAAASSTGWRPAAPASSRESLVRAGAAARRRHHGEHLSGVSVVRSAAR